MKAVLDLTKAITDKDYYAEQFIETDEFDIPPEKKILYVAPQLSSKHLYKFILPFFSFYNERVFTAITGLTKYDPYEQIVKIDAVLQSNEIQWADYIVFPFTTQDLSKQYGFYEAVREVNPNCKIVFYVDFNFYLLPDEHPHKELFEFPTIMDSTEKNILFADICLTNNYLLRNYLLDKFTELADTKYQDVEDIPVKFANINYLIDEAIVTQNLDFELQKSSFVTKKDIVKKVAEVAEEIKKDDLILNQDKAVKLDNQQKTPKRIIVKTTKVVADKSIDVNKVQDVKLKIRGYEQPAATNDNNVAVVDEIKPVDVIQPIIPETKTGDTVNNTEVINSVPPTAEAESAQPPVVDTPTPVEETATTVETPVEVAAPMGTPIAIIPQAQLSYVQLPRKYRIGIICSPSGLGDIKYYNEEFQKINERYGENVSLIFIGYDYEKDKNKTLEGVTFEYIKPVSIIHYFKQLQSLELDLVIVPLRKNNFNLTSECINKFLECGIFKIPIIVEDIFPYNIILRNQLNGFTYKGKENLIPELDIVLCNYDLMRAVGDAARKSVLINYSYTENNIDLVSLVYN